MKVLDDGYDFPKKPWIDDFKSDGNNTNYYFNLESSLTHWIFSPNINNAGNLLS